MTDKKIVTTVQDAVLHLLSLLDDQTREELRSSRREDIRVAFGYTKGIHAELVLWETKRSAINLRSLECIRMMRQSI